jgi:hypothetical protein
MKEINEQQIKQILDELLRVNVPSQTLVSIQNLFAKLPPVKLEEKKETAK